MRLSPIVAGLSVLVAAATLRADGPKSILWEDTASFKRVDDSRAHRFSQQLLLHQRNRLRIASAPSAESQDIGDVAVIVDNGSIVIPPSLGNSLDLALPTKFVFLPAAGGFSVAAAAPSFDVNVGAGLPLDDDDTAEVALGFAFPFLGVSYTSVWINSDGNLTFSVGDTETTDRDAARLIGGPPRVAPFLVDLNPAAGGTVSARVDPDGIVVTWSGVPQFGTTNVNTFQVTLQSNGTITFAYVRLDAQFMSEVNSFGVIGVAEGNNEGPFNEIDLTADLPGTFAAGAIFEEFSAAHGTQVDIFELSKEFYRTHGDKYDFLASFTDFSVDLGGAVAFETPVKNETRGLGLAYQPFVPGDFFDFTPDFGSQGELESFLMLNNVGRYWADEGKLVDPPIKVFRFVGRFFGADGLIPPFPFPPPEGPDPISRRARWFGTIDGFGSYTLGLNSAMSLMAQEVGHRWMAYVPFVHPTKGVGPDSFDLLGRAFTHWSFFFNVRVPAIQFPGDPRASSMEGNAIIDFGGNIFGDCVNPDETRFRTEAYELIDGYTELDQYLMGLRPASEVSPFWYVDEPTIIRSGISFEYRRVDNAENIIGFCGKRVNLTVANIQAFPSVGPRVPAIGDEIDRDATGFPQADVKTMAFILLVQQGQPNSPAHASAINQVDNLRRTWQVYVNGPATDGRGRFDTSLSPAIY